MAQREAAPPKAAGRTLSVEVFDSICDILRPGMSPEGIAAWLTMGNPLMADRRPLGLLLQGKVDLVLNAARAQARVMKNP